MVLTIFMVIKDGFVLIKKDRNLKIKTDFPDLKSNFLN